MPYRCPSSALINFSNFSSQDILISTPGYYILGEIPSNTSFSDIYSFCIDEHKKNILKNQKSILNLREFPPTHPTPAHSNPPANKILVLFPGAPTISCQPPALLLDTKE